jgi:CheY-like chemotaxis protein
MKESTDTEGRRDARPVMVVEDDPDIREAVQQLLEEEGFTVVTAANGAEAEEELTHFDPCVMLLDLTMPVMSGWELLEHMRRDGKLNDGIHVIVLSATPSGVPAGPVAILRKPVTCRQLIETIRHYC